MNKTLALILGISLLTGMTLSSTTQACVVKNGKNCPNTVAHKVDHKVKLSKPGMAGGLGAVTHSAAPMALGAATTGAATTASTTPADFRYFMINHQDGSYIELSQVQLQQAIDSGIVTPRGMVTSGHPDTLAIPKDAASILAQQATPNLRAPEPVATPTPTPIMVPQLQQLTPHVHRPADMPLRPNRYFVTIQGTGVTKEVPTEMAQRNPALTQPDGSLTPNAIAVGWTMIAGDLTAPNLAPQPMNTPQQIAPSQNPPITQVPVPQTVLAPNLAQPPHREVYTALHADIRPHEQAYDLHDPAFHLVVVGFKEP